jgi:hypothetical protein
MSKISLSPCTSSLLVDEVSGCAKSFAPVHAAFARVQSKQVRQKVNAILWQDCNGQVPQGKKCGAALGLPVFQKTW